MNLLNTQITQDYKNIEIKARLDASTIYLDFITQIEYNFNNE